MTVTRDHWMKWLALLGLIAAAIVAVAPVRANYIADAGSDYVVYRTASCGAPIVWELGGETGLGGGSPHPIGKVDADQACGSAVGRRLVISLSLALLVLVSGAAWRLTRRSTARSRERISTSA